MSAAFVFSLIAMAAILAIMAIRDHRRAIAGRIALLDDCRGLLGQERWTSGGDGIPTLEGNHGGHAVKVTLIPDTMVVRRLPQLWLSVTRYEQRPGHPSLAILARPMGNEFYAPIMDLPRRVEPPPGLPLDIMIRGSGPDAEALCNGLVPELKDLLADVRIKEITLAPKGIRITRQACEGRRGEHLLLRQAVFDGATVPRETLASTLASIEALSAAYVRQQEAHAA